MNIAQFKPLSIGINPLSVVDRIIANLELTPLQYSEAVKSYEAVADVLKKLHPLWRVAIFPQGSMRLGTTVRPILGECFDLDMVCWVALSGKMYTPEQIFNFVWDALGEDETYRQMRSKKNRCIRLQYADGRKFYLDVTPAVPDWAGDASLYVPDRERKIWCSSHPVGFCDEWFKKIAALLPIISITALANRSFAVMANEASVEPMPSYGEFEKTPLQRIVQMLKRDRDAYFQNDTTHRPSSILLTTITAKSYESLVLQPVEDLLDFVVKVVAKMPEYIEVVDASGSRKFSVPNPVNADEENFAENWTEEHYLRFLTWQKRIANSLQKIQQSKGLGADVMLSRLSETFGNEDVVKAARTLGADTNTLHDAGKLRVAGGVVGAIGAKIPITINFGK